jgi:hypothetical protein
LSVHTAGLPTSHGRVLNAAIRAQNGNSRRPGADTTWDTLMTRAHSPEKFPDLTRQSLVKSLLRGRVLLSYPPRDESPTPLSSWGSTPGSGGFGSRVKSLAELGQHGWVSRHPTTGAIPVPNCMLRDDFRLTGDPAGQFTQLAGSDVCGAQYRCRGVTQLRGLQETSGDLIKVPCPLSQRSITDRSMLIAQRAQELSKKCHPNRSRMRRWPRTCHATPAEEGCNSTHLGNAKDSHQHVEFRYLAPS